MSNGLDPDQDRSYVGPDLGPNCLQRLSADDKSPQAREELTVNPSDAKFFYFIISDVPVSSALWSAAVS